LVTGKGMNAAGKGGRGAGGEPLAGPPPPPPTSSFAHKGERSVERNPSHTAEGMRVEI